LFDVEQSFSALSGQFAWHEFRPSRRRRCAGEEAGKNYVEEKNEWHVFPKEGWEQEYGPKVADCRPWHVECLAGVGKIYGQRIVFKQQLPRAEKDQTSLKSWFWYWEEAELGFPKGRWTEGGSKVM
jgi:hypothetical protein